MAVTSSAPPQRGASDNELRCRQLSTTVNHHHPHKQLVCGLLALSLMVADALALNSAFIGVYVAKLADIRSSGLRLPASVSEIFGIILLFNVIFTISFSSAGLYSLRRGASRVDEAYKVFTAISLATVLTLVVNTLLPHFNLTGIPLTLPVLAVIWTTALMMTMTLRFFHRWLVHWLRSRGIDTRRVVIVGAREPGISVWRTIRNAPQLGYHVQGFLSDIYPVGSIRDGLPVLGHLHQLGRVVRATHADEVIISLSKRSQDELMHIVALAEDESVEIKVYPDTFQLITKNEISIGDLNGLPLVGVKNAALDNPFNHVLKRSLDVLFASVLLVFISPIMLLIALLVKLDSPGPVFFLQERVGMDGKPFLMIKFRTMRTDSEVAGAGWTVPGDPRITRIGTYLRRYSIDELPQFINVLTGQMSVVGPRPEQPRWVEQFSQQIPRYMRRHKEKAGITGWAQVNGLRGDTSIEERTRYDLYYVENWSLLFDVKIILRTAADVLMGTQENAY